MEFFLKIMEYALDLVRTEFTLYGYTFSFYSVIILILIFAIVCFMISYFL